MGFDINLEDARGKVLATVGDPQNHLHRLMERLYERLYDSEPLLLEIDWYGNTTFNRLQMPRFLSQWEVLAGNCESSEEAKIVSEVKELAKVAFIFTSSSLAIELSSEPLRQGYTRGCERFTKRDD